MQAFIRSLGVAAPMVMFHSGSASALDAAARTRAAEVFAETCVATFPSYNGIEGKLASLGFEQQKDATWKNSEMMVNPFVELSGGGRACLAWRHDADPIEISDLALKSISAMKVSNLKATRTGRRTTISFVSSQTSAVVKVEPLMKAFTSMTILAQ